MRRASVLRYEIRYSPEIFGSEPINGRWFGWPSAYIQDSDGNRHVLVYSLLFKFWTNYDFAPALSYLLSDSDSPIVLLAAGGASRGAA